MTDNVKKSETVEEFLARGGKITYCQPQEVGVKEDCGSTDHKKAPVVLEWGDALVLYGEPETKKVPKSTIDVSALPQELLDELGIVNPGALQN